MAQLDQFIQLLHQRQGQSIKLAGGQQVRLTVGDTSNAMTKNAVSETQVLSLIKEIAPADVAGQISATAQVRFAYAAPSGAVQIEMRPEGGTPMVLVIPEENGAAASPGSAPVVSGGDNEAHQEIDRLLRMLVESGGSDLHLRVGEPPIVRIDGTLVRQDGPPMEADHLQAMHESIMIPRDVTTFSDTGDADYAYEVEGLARFRCNAGRDRGGPLGVFRVIPAEIPTCEELAISPEIQKLCYLTKGLVLVTGPTGSGKSTTLAALVDVVNQERTDHMLTIEDPIEFVHPSKNCLVTHRQVGLHTDSFKTGLRAALREDPDIVLIGELRDLETAAIAIETAETGHLVFGTLHTTTAASTIDRIIDQFPADRQGQIRVMLSESLRGVIAQTLCKKIDGGRVAAREILLTNTAVSNLIREAKTYQIPSIIQTSRKAGMMTLNDSLFDLVKRKVVEPKEAYMKSVDKAGFEQQLQSHGINVAALLR
jgi:twitching motility protein PilT